MNPLWRGAVLALSCAALGVVVSCADRAELSSSPLSTSGPVVSLTPAVPSAAAVQGARVQAVTAYRQMWRAMARAGETSNWQDPALKRYATGAALDVITMSLRTDESRGWVSRGMPMTSPVVRSTDPPEDPRTVVIADCGDSSGWLKYRAGTGIAVGEGSGGGHRAITAEVQLQPDGAWRVSRFAVEELGSC